MNECMNKTQCDLSRQTNVPMQDNNNNYYNNNPISIAPYAEL